MKSERFRVFETIDEDDPNPKNIKHQLKMHNDMLSTLTQMDKEADALEEKLKEAHAEIKQLEKGKQTITYAVLGLILVVTSYWIVQIIEKVTGLSLLQ